MIAGMALIDEPEEKAKLEEIYYTYRSLMMYRAREILHDDYWAEDALSEAFMKIAKNIQKVRDVNSAETRHFAVILAERAAIDLYHKRNKHTTVSLEDVTEEPGYEEHPPQSLSPLAAAIVKLPPSYRQVILLKFSEGYNNREIAQMLDYSVSKVEKLISRGKKKLQKYLQEEGIEL